MKASKKTGTHSCCCKADNRLGDFLCENFWKETGKHRGSCVKKFENEASQSWRCHVSCGTLQNKLHFKAMQNAGNKHLIPHHP